MSRGRRSPAVRLLFTLAALVAAGMPGALVPAVAASPAVVASPGAASLTAAATTQVQMSITGLRPTVLRPGDTLRITGTLTNTGSTAASIGSIETVLETPRLPDPDAVSSWVLGGSAQTRTWPLATTKTVATLTAGESRPFAVSIRNATTHGQAPYGVLPLRLRAGDGVVRTFAAYERVKEYQPLRVAVLLPLTLGPDPELWSREPRARSAAWSRALGESGRLHGTLVGATKSTVDLAVDPTLLSADPTGATVTEEEVEVREGFRDDVVAAGRPIHVLPGGDADLEAVQSQPTLRGRIPDLLDEGTRAAIRVRGRADLIWPPAVTASTLSVARPWVTRQTSRDGTAMLLTSSEALRGDPLESHHNLAPGVPAVSSYGPLADALAEAVSGRDTARATQTLLAQTVTALNERPGTSRSVLIALPRVAPVDAQALSGALTGLASAPWVQPTTLANLPIGTRSPTTPLASPAPAAPPATPLTTAAAQRLSAAAGTLAEAVAVRADGATQGPLWGRELDQSLSTRWRGEPAAWSALTAPLRADAAATTTGLRVAMQDVTFLAESGRLNVTIHNDLPVAVTNLSLTLTSDSPRLRITEPTVENLRIGAGSKTVAAFEATALAAGPVELSSILTGPGGDSLAPTERSTVRVTPTGGWLYWVIGAVAALALVVGLWRTVRSPRKAGL